MLYNRLRSFFGLPSRFDEPNVPGPPLNGRKSGSSHRDPYDIDSTFRCGDNACCKVRGANASDGGTSNFGRELEFDPDAELNAERGRLDERGRPSEVALALPLNGRWDRFSGVTFVGVMNWDGESEGGGDEN